MSHLLNIYKQKMRTTEMRKRKKKRTKRERKKMISRIDRSAPNLPGEYDVINLFVWT